MPEQPFDPSSPSVNHDRSGLWAPDPLDEFPIEPREPVAAVATEPEVEFVGLLPEAPPLETRLGSLVPVALAPLASTPRDRRGLWSFASGTVFGALVCVILVSTLMTSAPPPSEPSAGGPATGPSPSAPAPVSPAASDVLPAQRSITVPDVPAVVEKASRAPTLTFTARRQAVPPAPVSSPRTQTRTGLFVGSLRIDSTPQGARVFINRQAAGVTPLIVPNLSAGSHAVRVEAEGYSSWSSAIRVVADRQNSVHAALTLIDSASIPR